MTGGIMEKSWGKIMVGVRLEKEVEAEFFRTWSLLLTYGLRDGDNWECTEGMPAHIAANTLIRRLLKSDCQSIFLIDSDCQIEKDTLHKLRDYELTREYDGIQVFYTRRGWPPEAIWFQRDGEGKLHRCEVLGETTEEVALIGTHCCLLRREIFEKMLGDEDPEKFDWFYYPRGHQMTEDAAFSFEAIDLGFKLGATTYVKAHHIGHVAIGWEAYQDYLRTSGQLQALQQYQSTIEQIGAFLGLTLDEAATRAANSKSVSAKWLESNPKTPEQIRKFYGSEDSGYFWDLARWNFTKDFAMILDDLTQFRDQDVLVIGPGLGTEAELLTKYNRVSVFEIPGALKSFCQYRLGKRVQFLSGYTLPEAVDLGPKFSLVVAVDVIEHVPSEEISEFLESISKVLTPGGILFCHNNFGDQDTYPMHFDHSQVFSEWAQKEHLTQSSPFIWSKGA
jgi:hypothetical protein